MKTLIVYAHPPVEAHCPYIFKEVKSLLGAHKISYDVIDLYKEKYDPVLHAKELYTIGNRDMSKQDIAYQKKVERCKQMIVIYPIWWNTMPAILKGFFDKVFVAGFAFKYDKGIPRKLLKGRTASVFLTSGSNILLSSLFLGNRAKKIMTHDILGFFGIKAKGYQLGGARRLTDGNKARITALVKKGLSRLYKRPL